MVQKAQCGKLFSHAGSKRKFHVKECSIALDTEVVEKEKQKPKITEETKTNKKDKPKSDITESKKPQKVVEYIKSKNDKTEKSENEQIPEEPEQPSTSKSSGLEMSTGVA